MIGVNLNRASDSHWLARKSNWATFPISGSSFFSASAAGGSSASAVTERAVHRCVPPRGAVAENPDAARILVIDDNPDMLDIYYKVLAASGVNSSATLDALDVELFGEGATATQASHGLPAFSIDAVQDGSEGGLRAKLAMQEGRPYAVAFVDMRMPGGLDGLETIELLWSVDSDIEVVICTAYSDYSWGEIAARLGRSDKLLFLRKPFDTVEVLQLASALSEKWFLRQQQEGRVAALRRNIEQSHYALDVALIERKRVEGELERFFSLSADVICVLDNDGRFKHLNPAVQRVLGYSPGELEGKALGDIVCDDVRSKTADWASACGQAQETEQVMRVRTRDGGYRWMEWKFSADEARTTWYGTGRDVTQREEIELTRKRLAAVLEGTTDIVFFIDSGGRVLYLNRRGRNLFGVAESDEVGRCIDDFFPAWARDIIRVQALPGAERNGTWRGETAVLHPEGHEIPVSQVVEVHRTSAHEVEFFSTILHDISDRKVYESHLRYQATHDMLTGLPNRTLFMEQLSRAVAMTKRQEEAAFMVAFIDLDRFKWINDTLGHEIGDEVLCTVSDRMSACLRSTDVLARIGGDEFAVLLAGGTETAASLAVIKRLVGCVAEPIALPNQEVMLTCSVGCSTYPENGGDADGLLRFADLAMYRAKQAGRNRLEIYDASLRVDMAERVQIASALRRAIEHNELELCYQPQVDLHDGRITTVEALLRWEHPVLGAISPAKFIPIAEDAGLIESIGEWVLLRACAQLKSWQHGGLPPVSVAVNVSAKQLDPIKLPAMVARCLAVSGLDARWLELELTETSAMVDPDMTFRLMRELRALGVGVAIDDFGTGYSNLSCLRKLPTDKLKLAGTFIDDIHADPSCRAIAQTVISLGHHLGLRVVAEMAETEAQITTLAELGCDEVQGYFFSQPVQADTCNQLLKQNGFTWHPLISKRESR